MKQAHIFYSGRVQGVGFRYTVLQCATPLHLCGWVRNLADGRVEIKCEGSQEQIDTLCTNVEAHFDGHITNKDINFSDTIEDLGPFRIEH